jgi:hypothetical protein
VKVEEYNERSLQVDGWPLKLTSYRLGESYHCQADNVSPGARLARTSAATREAAEEKALARARQLLSHTRLQSV